MGGTRGATFWVADEPTQPKKKRPFRFIKGKKETVFKAESKKHPNCD